MQLTQPSREDSLAALRDELNKRVRELEGVIEGTRADMYNTDNHKLLLARLAALAAYSQLVMQAETPAEVEALTPQFGNQLASSTRATSPLPVHDKRTEALVQYFETFDDATRGAVLGAVEGVYRGDRKANGFNRTITPVTRTTDTSSTHDARVVPSQPTPLTPPPAGRADNGRELVRTDDHPTVIQTPPRYEVPPPYVTEVPPPPPPPAPQSSRGVQPRGRLAAAMDTLAGRGGKP